MQSPLIRRIMSEQAQRVYMYFTSTYTMYICIHCRHKEQVHYIFGVQNSIAILLDELYPFNLFQCLILHWNTAGNIEYIYMHVPTNASCNCTASVYTYMYKCTYTYMYMYAHCNCNCSTYILQILQEDRVSWDIVHWGLIFSLTPLSLML